jgi:hypothetical protein
MIPLLTQLSAISRQLSGKAIAQPLSLTLLVFRRLADHPHYSLAVDDLALVTNFLYRCSDFHDSASNSQLPAIR